MAKIVGYPKLDIEVTLVISESEARAIDALAGYGHDAFIKAFYEFLGKAYMEQHEKGLRTFLKSVREESGIGNVLSRMDDVRKVWNGTRVAVMPPMKEKV